MRIADDDDFDGRDPHEALRQLNWLIFWYVVASLCLFGFFGYQFYVAA